MCSTPGASRNSSPAVEEKLGRKLTRVAGRGRRAAPGVRPPRAYRRARAEAGGPELDRRRAAGRQDHRRADARRSRRSRADFGDGDIRLTVWQNLLISGVPDDKVAPVEARDRGARAHHQGHARSAPGSSPAPATPAATSPPPTPRGTRERSPRGARRASTLDTPVNIHLTGCHHSCAQHYIGDIGLIGARRGRRGRRHGRGLSRRWSAAASAPDASDRPRDLSGREGRGRAAHASSAAARPISRTATCRSETFLAFTRHGTTSSTAAEERCSTRRSGPSMSRRTCTPPIPLLVPETAPFIGEQRAWLNGFFAGAGLARRRRRRRRSRPEQRRSPLMRLPGRSTTATTARRRGTTRPCRLPERMKLAEGRPLRRRMMAAMAQQDCGQCGYNCAGLFQRDLPQEGGAAEPVRAGRQGNRPHAEDASRRARQGARRGAARSAAGGAGRGDRAAAAGPLARQSGRRRPSCRARGSTEPAPRRKPGTSRSILRDTGLDYKVGDRFGVFPTNDPGPGRCGHRALDAPAGFADRRPHAARGADRRASRSRPRPTRCSSYLLSHRRRAAPQKAKALAAGEDPGRRRRDARRARRRSRNFPASAPTRKPSSRRSIRCSRGSIRSRPRPRPIPAGCRSPSTPCATRSTSAHAPRRRLDLPRRARHARRPAQGLCAEGARLRRCRPIRRRRSSWSGPAPASRRSAPSCRSAWRPRRRAATGCSSATSARPPISSTRTSSTGMKATGVLTRLSLAWSRDGEEKFYVQDRMREVGARAVALARRRRAFLRLRRRQAHGEGRRARAGRHRGAARRALDRRGDRLRRPS